MEHHLRVLILEDVKYDAELIEYELHKLSTPVSVMKVATREAFLEGLEKFQPNLILADYRLPGFDGLMALALSQEECPGIPFIFVSGTMNEELAQKGLDRGAAAFLTKDKLSRLVMVVKRILRYLNSGETPPKDLWDSEEFFWTGLFQGTNRMMVILSLDRIILEFNRGAEILTGWSRQDALGEDLIELLVPPEKRRWIMAKLAGVAAGKIIRDFEMAIRRYSGVACPCLCRFSLLTDWQEQPAVILLVAEEFKGRLRSKKLSEGRIGKTLTIIRHLTSFS